MLSVVALPLAPFIRSALLSAGLSSVADLRGLSQAALCEVARLSPEHAAEVLTLALGRPASGWRLEGAATAAQLLEEERRPGSRQGRRIPTGCRALDDLLCGGVACGAVTEFFGVPGVGKTQMGMQLSVNVQLPAALGGLGGAAVYVDTEGSFMVERLVDMAEAAVQRAEAAAGEAGAQQQQQPSRVSVESLLSGVLHFRVQHHVQQLALAHVLDLLLQQQPQVRLVVVDSATFHFRQDFPDAAQRGRLLASMAQQLAALAEARGVAVVMVNQVVTRVADARSGQQQGGAASSWLAPALGEGWGQAASCRVALFWRGPQRYALLLKAKDPPPPPPQQQQQQQQHVGQLCVPFSVGPRGVGD